MALRPEDRRLLAYLVESAAAPVSALLSASVEAAAGRSSLGACLLEAGALGHEELERLWRELDRLRPPMATEQLGKTLIPATHRPEVSEAAVTTPRVDVSLPDLELSRQGDPPGVERYIFSGEIARGGMGRVLRGFDPRIGREVAVKVLLSDDHSSTDARRRFWMEIQATGQLEHPSIVPVHDVGELSTGEPFYVMKLLSGRTLAEILSGVRRGIPALATEFTRSRLLTVFQQVCYAVAFAHARGVIHRDIKPANIMIGRFGEVTLLDWGLAKLLRTPDPRWSDAPPVAIDPKLSRAVTQEGTITGTPQYMAPEAVDAKPEVVREPLDVYGLGAVLYEILTLEPAFPDEGLAGTLLRVRSSDFVRPTERAPDRGISPELEQACLWAMHPLADQRPSARQLADDIGSILEGTRERERRQVEARARVAEGRTARDRWRRNKEELATLGAEVGGLNEQVPPWAPASEKLPIWELEDRESQLRVEAIGAFEEAETALQRALGEVPDDREARRLLAGLYYERFAEAERARDREGERYYKSLVARYDDGTWARVLTGKGRLSVRTDQPFVEVELAKVVTKNRLLTPSEPRTLGPAPIRGLELPIGGYLLTLRPRAGRPVLQPVLIRRLEEVEVSVQIPSDPLLGEDFVFVPGGRCILGGDPVAHGALARREVDVPSFAIGRCPITCEEYLAFLDDSARTDLAGAQKRVPRVKEDDGHYWGWRPERAGFELPAPVEGKGRWSPRNPVFGVSFDDAKAYAAWRSEKTGERFRLPTEDEWEKAARGVDGRIFPWGDHFDPTFCKMKDSRNGPLEPEPVGTFATDCSPYGVLDLAGGVRELCVHFDAQGQEVPVMRGGCWHDTGLFCRLAFRHVTKRDFVNTGLGFRLVKELVIG